MMKLCVCIWFIALMCVPHWCSAEGVNFSEKGISMQAFRTGQERDTIKVDLVNMKGDTTWVVNFSHSEVSEKFKICLLIPDSIPKKESDDLAYVRVTWVSTKGNEEVSDVYYINNWGKDSTMNYEYNKGINDLVVEYYKENPGDDKDKEGDVRIKYRIFNTSLSGEIEHDGVEACINREGRDKYIFRMKAHEFNPPGTKYHILVIPDDARVGQVWTELTPNGTEDTATIQFLEPLTVGVKFMIIYDEGTDRLKSYTPTSLNLSIYDKPNLAKIFKFDYTNEEDIGVCTGDALGRIAYDSLLNERYRVSGMPHYGPPRVNYEVDYYRKEAKDGVWTHQTTDTTIDEQEMIFNHPGFYKINIRAWNDCGRDTLKTDSIVVVAVPEGKGKGEKTVRDIVVSQNSAGKIRCDTDVICGDEKGDTIIFVDFGKRFGYDQVPEYKFEIKQNDGDFKMVEFDTVFYLADKVISETSDKVGFECDSAHLKVPIKGPGIYNIKMSRSSACSDTGIVFNHTVRVGGAPTSGAIGKGLDAFFKGTSGYLDYGQPLRGCDDYTLDISDKEIKIDSNYMTIDSILWICKQGSNEKLDTLFRPSEHLTYNFDSTEVNSNLKVQAKNKCGTGEVNMTVYRSLTPEFDLTRNGVEDDPNLCIDKFYEYNLKGTFPKYDKYTGTATFGVGFIQFEEEINGGMGLDKGEELKLEGRGTNTYYVASLMYNNFYTTGGGDSYDETYHIIHKDNQNCHKEITETVYIWDGKMNVSGIDTIKTWPLGTHKIELEDGLQIDTGDIKGSITWTSFTGGTFEEGSEVITTYTMSDADKGSDTVLLQLSGTSMCSEALKDTLIVIVPQPKLYPGRSTICVGGEYSLWGSGSTQTAGKFINENTLKWEITDGSEFGTLSSSEGTSAIFKADKNNRTSGVVKIKVTASQLYRTDDAVDVTEIVEVIVNASPQHIFPDTLNVDASEGKRVIVLADINNYKLLFNDQSANSKEIKWKLEGGEGGPTESNGKVSIGSPPSSGNYSTNLSVTYTAKDGCADSTRYVIFMGIVPPIAKLEDIKYCGNEGSEITLDNENYKITAKDEHTESIFSDPDNVANGGSFSENIYTIGTIPPETFILTATKEFVSYDKSSITFTDKDTADVKVIGEPEFSLMTSEELDVEYSTLSLCAIVDTFPYDRSWIKHNGAEHGYDEHDFETGKSTGLTGSFPKFTLKDGVTEAKLIVHLNMGNCVGKGLVSDTLVIKRNAQTAGKFEDANICETETHQIMISDMVEGQDYNWGDISGGTIDENNRFTPTSPTEDKAYVRITLKLKPAGGTDCAWDEYTGRIIVEKTPTFDFNDGHICEDGTYDITYKGVDSIIWKIKDDRKIDTTKGNEYKYKYNEADVKSGKIELIAKITPTGQCTTMILDTITLIESKKVILPTDLSVCQGDSLDLTGMVKNMKNYELSIPNGIVGIVSYEKPYYYPKEFVETSGSGKSRLFFKGEGLEGCSKLITNTIFIDVETTINPKFEASGGCAGDLVEYEVDSKGGGIYEWKMDGSDMIGLTHKFPYIFMDADTADLKLTTTLGECTRSYTKEIITKALPNFKILMTPDKIVGIGQTVDFTVDLEDAKIKSYLWDFQNKGSIVTNDPTARDQKRRYETIETNRVPVELKIVGTNDCSATKTKEFKVVGAPVAIIDSQTFDKCTGKIELHAKGEGTYLWSLGGESSTGGVFKDSLPSTFRDTTYVIKLTVTNGAGSHDTTFSAEVISKLDSEFSYAREGATNCGDLIIFRNASKGEADSLTFVWGDGNDSTYLLPAYLSKDIPYSYGNASGYEKTYTPELVAHNSCYNDTSEIKNVRVHPSDFSINFSYTEGPLCKNAAIPFTNLSKGLGPIAYWYFGDDDPVISADEIVKHPFAAPGTYEVTLKMYNTACGWSDSKTKKIFIGGTLGLDFDIKGTKCSGQEINFKMPTEVKDTFNSYEWIFSKESDELLIIGDTSSVTVSFEEGSYNVLLKALSSDGTQCPMEKRKDFIVNNVQEAKITIVNKDDTVSCLPHIVSKFYRSEVVENTKVKWDFGNEDKIADVDTVRDVKYTTAGEYMVTLTTTASSGCVDVDSMEITTLSTPEALFELSDTLLCGDRNILTITNKTNEELKNYRYKWWQIPYKKDKELINDINSVLVTDRGWTLIELVATDNATKCTNTYIDSVRSGAPVGLRWGEDLEGASIEHCGEDTEVLLKYGYSDGDLHDSLTHHYRSVDLGEGFVPFKTEIWERLGSVSHTYGKETKNEVKLAIVTQDGCRDTIERKVNVYKQPIPFEVTMPRAPYCTGQDINMHINPGDIKDSYTDFTWDLGNNNTVSGDSATANYLRDTTYSIKVTAKSISEGNCVSKHTENIKPYQTPRTGIYQKKDSIKGCTPLTVEKFSFAGNDDDQVEKFRWTFIDGEGSDLTEPTNIKFRRAGEHMVLLSVTAHNKCIGRDTVFVTAEATPDVSFTFPDTAAFSCLGGLVDVKLTNTTSEPEKSEFVWYYALDSLNIVSEYKPLWVVPDPVENFYVNHLGDIRLKLVAEDKLTYCVDSFVDTIVSGRLVNLQAIIDTALCYGDQLKIGATTAEPEETTITLTLGDGVVKTIRDTFNYTYDNPGPYEFKMVAENSFGCRDSLQHTIAVYPLPIADFDFEKGHSDFDEMGLPEGVDFDKLPDVENGVVIFTDNSDVEESFAPSRTLYYTWNFGDSTSSDLKDPKHRFHSNASYEIKLLVNTDYGCTDSTTQYVDIKAIKGLFMPNAFAPSAGDSNKEVALFQPKGVGLLSYKIQVYDKTGGTCVWSSDRLVEGKPADAWDGTFNGQPLPKDYYVWKASAIFIDGTVWNGKNGMVNLIR